jgi:dipeptidyl aminopeptidase/acylaminoacyl peptidase
MREIPCSDLSALKVRLDFNLSPLLSTLKNILIFHGGADQVVPVSNALEIFRSAQDPKRLILQQKGDHSVSDPVHQNEFLRETAIWLAENLLA